MERTPSAALALACCLLVLSTAVAAPLAGEVAAAQTAGGDAENGSDGVDDGSAAAREVGPITECFAGDGYPLAIGDPPATIDALVHLSVLTDRENGGEFGVELAGTLDGEPIVTLAAGVRLSRSGLLATGVNPFAAFDLLYAYEFRLPMFSGSIDETTYEEDSPPVSSAAGTVPC